MLLTSLGIFTGTDKKTEGPTDITSLLEAVWANTDNEHAERERTQLGARRHRSHARTSKSAPFSTAMCAAQQQLLHLDVKQMWTCSFAPPFKSVLNLGRFLLSAEQSHKVLQTFAKKTKQETQETKAGAKAKMCLQLRFNVYRRSEPRPSYRGKRQRNV